MKKLLIILILFTGFNAFSQKNYDDTLDGMAQIKEAVAKAKAENKQVLVQVGGNWCKYCIQLHDFMEHDIDIKNKIDKYYVYINVNYSEENRNYETMKLLNFPQRFGFPSLHIVGNDGRMLNNQGVENLSNEENFDKTKILKYLDLWTVFKMNPVQYK